MDGFTHKKCMLFNVGKKSFSGISRAQNFEVRGD
jgi:hypothetical protein